MKIFPAGGCLLTMPAGITFLCGFAAGALLLSVWVLVLLRQKKRMMAEQKALEEKAQDAEAEKRKQAWLLCRVSHEMRTPLGTVLGLSHLMRNETDPTALKKDAGQLDETGKFLLSLINDLLDASRADNGCLRLNPRPTVFEDVVNSVLFSARLMAKDKGLRFEIGEYPDPQGEWLPVLVDAPRLQQVFLNLISNAVKYTPYGGTVTVGMRCLSRKNQVLTDCFFVRDTGIGIDPMFLPHIFEPFTQEGKMNTATGYGSGLGLCITKQIVDLMGGTIEIDSKPDEGTEVRVVVSYPVYEGTLEQKDAGELPRILAGKRILVVEDGGVNAAITARILEKAGAVTELARDGREGERMFRMSENGYYSAVLTDICMPGMDGYALAEAIRAMPRGDAQTVPVIAVTGDVNTLEKCISAGMNAHIVKPVDAETLLGTLAEFL